jgi:hypothetical protein
MTGMDCDANSNNDIHNHLESVSIPEVRKQFKRLDTVEETELQRSMVERVGSDNNEFSCSSMVSINEGSAMTSELNQDTMEPERQEQSPQSNQGIGSVITTMGEHEEQSPVSVLETHFRDDKTCQIEFQMSEGMAYHILLQNNSMQGSFFFFFFFLGIFCVEPIPYIIGFARDMNSFDCIDLVKENSIDLII